METKSKKKASPLVFLFLHVCLMISSLSALASKKAAGEEFLSPRWLFYYGIVLGIMFLYAVAWQQILKYLPLSVAYVNKAVGLLWGMVWGTLFYHEQITIKMLVGIAIIFAGIYLVVTENE